MLIMGAPGFWLALVSMGYVMFFPGNLSATDWGSVLEQKQIKGLITFCPATGLPRSTLLQGPTPLAHQWIVATTELQWQLRVEGSARCCSRVTLSWRYANITASWLP